MKWRISGVQTPGSAGWFAHVELFIQPIEHVTIKENKCRHMELIRGTPHKFSRVYDTINHQALIPVDSSTQTDIFIGMLDQGLREVDALIKRAARTKPRVAPLPPKPWDFFDTDARFGGGTWLKAKSDWGKTSLLSALIMNDLKKVEAGEASVLIIDSQNDHLGKFFPRLPIFGPGGALEGKLIYFEPDLDFPLALNLFDFTGLDALSTTKRFVKGQIARDMLLFFMNATVGDPSGHMRNILGFALRALMLMERPTIFTLQELLVKGRLKNMEKDHPRLRELDDAAKKYLYTDMFNSNYSQSLEALNSRLHAFTENDYLRFCFSQPENRFDLYTVLQEPRVIVVNLNKEILRDYQSIMGRFFLAQLLGVVNSRTNGGLDCYTYLDEAHLFIKDEPVVEQLVAQARRARIALTYSHQWASQVGLTAKALEHCGVQIGADKRQFSWVVQVNQGDLHHIQPPYIDFKKMDGMPDPAWFKILDEMHKAYCVLPPSEPRGEPPKGRHKNISEE